MPKKVDECVQAILKSNPDLTESEAWAICQDRYNKGLLNSDNNASKSKKDDDTE